MSKKLRQLPDPAQRKRSAWVQITGLAPSVYGRLKQSQPHSNLRRLARMGQHKHKNGVKDV
jgi:mRNA-degrading endonuclease RelE of RelBE toxin-antitoxin system